MEITINFAEHKDEMHIKKLLSEASLPYEDISKNICDFLIASINNEIIGVVGIEILGEFGLLRSLAVTPSQQGNGIGKLLCNRMISYASLNGVKKLYLLTTTAKSFFENFNFKKIAREDVKEVIKNTNEYSEICPVSAVVMVKEICDEVVHYPKDVLRLQEDVPGSMMWAVSLEKTMVTYFEVNPDCHFEHHHHESEQITFVIEGELFFDINGEVHCVKKGETIAIPSNIPHAVFTNNKSAKAVDAWSPVMMKYRNKKFDD